MNRRSVQVVRADNPSPMTLDGTRTFVVGADRPFIIDPGPDDPIHLQAVLRLLAGAKPEAILLTHAHGDHAGNAVALAASTGAPIWMARGARHPPFASKCVDRWLVDQEEIGVRGNRLQVIATPGHTPEHLAFFRALPGALGTLFAGDLFLGAGDTTLVSAPEGNVGAYLRSLEVVRALNPGLIYPAHGPALVHPEQVVARYREHRMGRIGQLREVRKRFPQAELEDLIAPVYGAELDPRLYDAARGSIQAMVEYLESREGAGS